MAGNKKVKTKKANKTAASGKVRKPFWLQLIICLLVLAIFCCLLTYNYVLAEFEKSQVQTEVEIDESTAEVVYIKYGWLTDDIAEMLKEKGFINNITVYKIVSKYEGYDGRYKTGSHILSKGMELTDIMKVLSSEPETVKITFPEGFNIKKIAARLEANGMGKAEDFIKTVNTVDFSKDYPFLKGLKDRDNKLEGYLFPDTYIFDIRTDHETIIRTMLDRFESLYLEEYTERAENLGLTMDEVVTLASIVEKEGKLSKERRRIAGVFYNRLKRPKSNDLKKLQSCATLQYIIERDTGEIKETITAEDEKIQDLYNTYIYEGLPPGPICSPSLESIKSIIYVEHHDYFYFKLKSGDSGEHSFAKTYSEHLKN